MKPMSVWMRWTLLVALAVVAPMFGGCANDKQVISQASQVHTGLQPAVVSDPELSAYIQKVGDRVIVAAQQKYQEGYRPSKKSKEDYSWMFSKGMQFHLVSSDQLNAFTTGGEHMYVYSKLFEECRSEDEMAAVMSHEFAHVFGRHVESGMNRQTAMMVGAAAAGGAGYAAGKDDTRLTYAASFAGAAMAAGQFVGLGYTRGDEREADAMGFAFYVRAGWDPKKFGDFFQYMIDKGYDTTPEMVSDHPSLASRVQVAKQEAAKLPPDAAKYRQPPVTNAAQFKALQAKAVSIDKSMVKTPATDGAKLMLTAFPSCVSPTQTREQQTAQQRLAAIQKQMQAK